MKESLQYYDPIEGLFRISERIASILKMQWWCGDSRKNI